MRPAITLFILLYCFSGFAQYDTDLLKPAFHKGRREALRAMLPDSSCAVIFAGPERQRANDTKFIYHQDPSFYYLTGFNEPDAVLVIYKEPIILHDTVSATELIFVRKKNPAGEAWTGRIAGPAAMKDFGFDHAFANTDFTAFDLHFRKMRTIYESRIFDDVRDDTLNSGDLYSLISHFNNDTRSAHNVDHTLLSEYLATLRQVKTAEELTLMRKTIDMSVRGHLEVMKALEPGMKEYQAQAVAEYIFKREGSEYVGYPSIVGGGENSCILHYETNRKELGAGDLLVIDAGAEYHGYSADITRTLPVDGTFSPEQQAIYDLVLQAQEAGIRAARAGNEFRATHKAAVAVIKKGLMDLGIIKDPEDYLLYFFHGTSHYLGLDVHDAGTYGKLAPGNIITVEPGIYIPAGSPCDPKWWNIGVRIEDDILVTAGEPENLSGRLPRNRQEIEALMKQESLITH